MLSAKFIYLIGREVVKKGPEKGQIKEVLKRQIDLDQVRAISTRCENTFPNVCVAFFPVEMFSSY